MKMKRRMMIKIKIGVGRATEERVLNAHTGVH